MNASGHSGSNDVIMSSADSASTAMISSKSTDAIPVDHNVGPTEGKGNPKDAKLPDASPSKQKAPEDAIEKKEPDSLKKTLQERIQALETMRRSVAMLRTLPGILMKSPWNDGGISDLSDLGISVDGQIHDPSLKPTRRVLQDFESAQKMLTGDSVQASLKMAKESDAKTPISKAEVLRTLRRARRGLDLDGEEDTTKKRCVVFPCQVELRQFWFISQSPMTCYFDTFVSHIMHLCLRVIHRFLRFSSV